MLGVGTTNPATISWILNVTYRFSGQWFQLGVNSGQLGILQLTSQGLDGSERRVNLHGPAGFVSLQNKGSRLSFTAHIVTK